MRFSPASRLQGYASLLIKHKAAAHGNMGETSGRLTDATNWGIAFGTLAARGSPSQKTNLRGLAARCARVLPGFTLENKRAQGMPGARCTRGLVCKLHKEMRTRAYRFSGGNPAFPAQWLDGLCRALPGDEFVLSPSLPA